MEVIVAAIGALATVAAAVIPALLQRRKGPAVGVGPPAGIVLTFGIASLTAAAIAWFYGEWAEGRSATGIPFLICLFIASGLAAAFAAYGWQGNFLLSSTLAGFAGLLLLICFVYPLLTNQVVFGTTSGDFSMQGGLSLALLLASAALAASLFAFYRRVLAVAAHHSRR